MSKNIKFISITVPDKTIIIPLESIEFIEIRKASEYDLSGQNIPLSGPEIREYYSTINIQVKNQQYRYVVKMPCDMLEAMLLKRITGQSVIRLQAIACERW